uniref:Uncharacterized protein n=1 Tax=Physcomitrium patens TaxID=3218 RepID=A0A2K1KG32_PHYPA|nr:hypothetical protein PHYPA_009106 [Physcomitrium patens]
MLGGARTSCSTAKVLGSWLDGSPRVTLARSLAPELVEHLHKSPFVCSVVGDNILCDPASVIPSSVSPSLAPTTTTTTTTTSATST